MDVPSYLLGKQSGGGGEANLQSKSVTITSNGNSTVLPDSGYDGLSNVGIVTNVQPDLETKSVTITENTTTTITPTIGKDGMSSVEVTTNVPTGGGADLSEYFNNTLTENKTSYTPSWDYIKKLPDLIIADNVTQVSYLFDRNYFYVNGKNLQAKIPKVICNSNVIDMSYMYASYNSDTDITQIDLSGLDTSNVTNMGYMFFYRRGLTTLNLNTLNFSKVNNCAHMFDSCLNLTLLNLNNLIGESFLGSNFELNSTFYNCSNLKIIDLSNLNPTKKIDTRSMVYGCTKLEELYLDKWDLGNLSPSLSTSMFTNCGSQLTDGAVTKVYVKDADAQNWVLTASNGHPSTWTTDNVIIAGSAADLRGIE